MDLSLIHRSPAIDKNKIMSMVLLMSDFVPEIMILSLFDLHILNIAKKTMTFGIFYVIAQTPFE